MTTKQSAARLRAKQPGDLIVIGGREDKENDRSILREVALRAGSGKLVISTLASDYADEQWTTYLKIFTDLGVKKLSRLDYSRREDAMEHPKLEVLKGAKAIFFAGGDQLKLTSRIAGTPVFQQILKLHASGVAIAGTSAGAAAMSESMLVGRAAAESHKVGSAFFTAAGLGLLKDIIIDQHFAQRWRVGRLVGVVAEKPTALGVGIDEDTAIVVRGSCFEVIGNGAVYVVDGSGVTYTNISEHELNRTMAVFDIRLHVLKSGNRFDIQKRRPQTVRP